LNDNAQHNRPRETLSEFPTYATATANRALFSRDARQTGGAPALFGPAPGGVGVEGGGWLIDGVYDTPPGMMQIGKTGVVPCLR
jgi:hypothetical protein